ncbi:monocarboxylate transporter 13-like [Patiria miniata]|uniref:Major facilitator superfamily (MFS) profile domain-containing protein n=1 Tax=Patiria miniata TaxID=46514 RepID=A0A914BU34_PATMI|nr:monocarboxylate transporter 13-like [Patiria miniata]XP_038079322.1 monocarboxylate transporter 13-like [Patiria miniata]
MSSTKATAAALPIDRGWAWFVLIGVHVSFVLSNGYLTALGVFYIEWKDYFQTDATATSWLLSLPLLVASPLSFFVGILSSSVGIRWIAMTGAAVNGLATILGSRTTDIRQLYVCTALSGVGAIMMISPGSIVISHYFKKRFALASGISVVGVSVGQMLFPPLIRVLVTMYGWRGAMFVIGALQMNGVAACALFRPLKTSVEEDKPQGERSGNSSPMLSSGNEDCEEEAENSSTETQPAKSRRCSGYLKVFTNLPAMLNLLSCCFYATAAIVNITHLPARSKEAGWSDDQSAMLLLVYAVFSVVTRLSNGWFVDRGYVGPIQLQLGAIAGATLATFLNPVSDSYAYLVVNAILTGSCIGMSAPLYIVNMRLMVGASELPAALSLIWGVVFFFNASGTVIAGKIFDLTGNYVAPFLTAGAIFLICFLLLVTVAVVKRRRDKDRRRLERAV